jgi:hypothetical protein
MKIEDAPMSQTMSQIKALLRVRAVPLLIALLVGPGVASALPSDFLFTSGQMTLRAELDDANNTSILNDPDPAVIQLGGSFVRFDPDSGSFGTLIAFSLIPAGTIELDLDESVTTLDSISILSAHFTEAPGATADLNAFGQFTIDSLMSAEVSAVLAGGGSFGPEVLPSLESVASGFLFISGDQLELDLEGVNLARFAQVGGSPGDPDVLIKADFRFFGVVPEPGTALLLGLGLAGLAAGSARQRS